MRWQRIARRIDRIAEDCRRGDRTKALRDCRELLEFVNRNSPPVPPLHLPIACGQLERGELDRAYWTLNRAAERLRRAIRKRQRERSRRNPNAP